MQIRKQISSLVMNLSIPFVFAFNGLFAIEPAVAQPQMRAGAGGFGNTPNGNSQQNTAAGLSLTTGPITNSSDGNGSQYNVSSSHLSSAAGVTFGATVYATGDGAGDSFQPESSAVGYADYEDIVLATPGTIDFNVTISGTFFATSGSLGSSSAEFYANLQTYKGGLDLPSYDQLDGTIGAGITSMNGQSNSSQSQFTTFLEETAPDGSVGFNSSASLTEYSSDGEFPFDLSLIVGASGIKGVGQTTASMTLNSITNSDGSPLSYTLASGITLVSEPNSLVLFGIGALGLFAAARRSRSLKGRSIPARGTPGPSVSCPTSNTTSRCFAAN